MRTIKLFVASSSELKEDRDQFRMFISQENDRLHTKGLYLEMVQWENFLDSISSTRLQDEYNKAIRGCDIVVCLFFTKVGKYTAEEFDTAYQVFKDEGKPHIWTYFKNAHITIGSITEEINTLLEFKKKIGSLGHFYTEYTSIDNLINKYRTQLDKFLPKFESGQSTSQQGGSIAGAGSENDTQPSHVFNELLTAQLIEGIKPYHNKASDFLTSNPNWASNPYLVQTAKRILIGGYVGVLGIQLRKLMSIGEEDYSKSKLKRYLENCHQTARRGLQLITYAMISSLWDYRQKGELTLNGPQSAALTVFFRKASEGALQEYAKLLSPLMEAFSDNNLEYPIPELADFRHHLRDNSPFIQACEGLQEVKTKLSSDTFNGTDCLESEKQVALILEKLSFLAGYRMISIKDIDYDQQRNEPAGLYLHHYTLLEGDSQATTTQVKIRKESSPLTSYAVLLFKGNLINSINLVPFIIDFNGMALAGGSKICFYSHCNTFDDQSLNFDFIEDNAKINLKKSGNPKPADREQFAINNWLSIPDNRKDLNFDNVFHLFQEAKKALTGLEEAASEDSF